MTTTPDAPPPPALRIIHLAGGHRAFDLGDADVRIGPEFERAFLTFPTPAYTELYVVLASIGLRIIGVDFITGPTAELNRSPPDFQPFSADGGFTAMRGERAWSDVKNVPEQRTAEILDLSERFTSYHRLLALRVRDLSEAYRRSLAVRLVDIDGRYSLPKDRTLFSNGFQVYVEAAIHAFLADAAALRDLIAEGVWRLILKEPDRNVTTLATFLKRTRGSSREHPLVAELQQSAGDRAWLKTLTDLRNSIIHIAPLANTHELHMSQVRDMVLRGGSIPTLHYPLTSADGGLRPRPEPIDFNDSDSLRSRLQAYHEFVDASGDALIYASDTAMRLIGLATRVREAAGLSHQMLHLTDTDIIGPVRVVRGNRPSDG